MNRIAEFSAARLHRFTLWREARFGWRGVRDPAGTNAIDIFDHRFVQFVGLNPSTADEVADDNTIRRCVGFAREWGFKAFCMTNIFSVRSTDPAGILEFPGDPIGTDNDMWIMRVADAAERIVAGWGNHGVIQNRGNEVALMLEEEHEAKLFCFGLTKEHQPKHPLYIKGAAQLIPFGLIKAGAVEYHCDKCGAREALRLDHPLRMVMNYCRGCRATTYWKR